MKSEGCNSILRNKQTTSQSIKQLAVVDSKIWCNLLKSATLLLSFMFFNTDVYHRVCCIDVPYLVCRNDGCHFANFVVYHKVRKKVIVLQKFRRALCPCQKWEQSDCKLLKGIMWPKTRPFWRYLCQLTSYGVYIFAQHRKWLGNCCIQILGLKTNNNYTNTLK